MTTATTLIVVLSSPLVLADSRDHFPRLPILPRSADVLIPVADADDSDEELRALQDDEVGFPLSDVEDLNEEDFEPPSSVLYGRRFEGDILGVKLGLAATNASSAINVTLWPEGVIPYTISK